MSALALAHPRGSIEPTSDADLVGAVQRGSDSAFEAIFDRYHKRILSFCRHMLGNREDGEDATQQVFVAAHQALRSSSKEIELRAWLFAIARNRCLDMLRARRATDSLDASTHDPPAVEGLPEAVQRREDLRALVSDIGALPEEQRAALVLFELGGLPQRQLADVLDCRPEQVKALIYQARSSLMADRAAREAHCREIREEIAAARGHDLLRSHLRRHVRVCPDCRTFVDDTRRQRAALALALPVLPTVGLKASTLSAVAAGTAGAAAGPAGGGVAGGLSGLVGKGIALKAVAVLCIAGAASGIGYTIVHRAATAPPASASEPHAGTRAPALSSTTHPATTAAVTHRGATGRPAGRPARATAHRASRHAALRHSGVAGTFRPTVSSHAAYPAHARIHGLRHVRAHAPVHHAAVAPTSPTAPPAATPPATSVPPAPAGTPPSSQDSGDHTNRGRHLGWQHQPADKHAAQAPRAADYDPSPLPPPDPPRAAPARPAPPQPDPPHPGKEGHNAPGAPGGHG